MKTFKQVITEIRLPKFSVFKKDREGGHIHIDDFDKHSEAKQEALLSSAEDPHVDHMIVHNQTGIPTGIFKGGKHIFNEEHLTERLWVHRLIQKPQQCAATATKMVLDYHNIPSDSAEEIHSQTGPENRGRRLSLMANHVNSHYDAAATVKRGSINILRDSVKKHGPVIASVKSKVPGQKHSVVVLKVTKNNLHVVNPTKESRGRFTDREVIPLDRYNGSHMVIRPYTG